MNSYHNTLISNSDNGKTKFNENDEETLSQWMRENLLIEHNSYFSRHLVQVFQF